jgi:hypothetical protein
MLVQTTDAFTGLFGQSTKNNRKVLAWGMRPDAGVVVEKPARSTATRIWVWVPCAPRAVAPAKAIHYRGDEGRHSNAYAVPGLKRGMPAYRVPVESAADLDALSAYLTQLPPIPSGSASA